EGRFVLAVWNDATRTLVRARDRLGIKPVYYAVLPEGLVFASELKAMFEHPGVSRELDMQALSAYLAHDWVPAPRSMLKSVRKLPPGHRLIYAGGEARVECWWDVRYDGGEPMVEVQAAAKLGAVLDLAVRQHLLSDVPLGVFLSGGLDSSTVAMFARRHVNRLSTFSIGFDDRSFDESTYARRVAAILGTEHHEEVLGPNAALDLVEGLGDLVDEPLGDASILPTYLLSRFARKSVTVALSGDGGDELFAGYPTYQAHRVAHTWARAPRAARRAARPADAGRARAAPRRTVLRRVGADGGGGAGGALAPPRPLSGPQGLSRRGRAAEGGPRVDGVLAGGARAPARPPRGGGRRRAAARDEAAPAHHQARAQVAAAQPVAPRHRAAAQAGLRRAARALV